MARHILQRAKTFSTGYCGCLEAVALTNEAAIQDSVNYVKAARKSNNIPAALTLGKDGITIIYNNDKRNSTYIPSTLVAGSTISKSASQDMVGVVYITPPSSHQYPAFVHVYQCNTSRIAQKLLSRLRSYLLNENHRLRIVQLEQDLVERNLLNYNRFYNDQQQKINRISSPPSISTTATVTATTTTTAATVTPTTNSNNHNRQDRIIDPIKSITQEFQKKIDSNEPILYPPKDYDIAHSVHGNMERTHAWRSTEPTIIGYSPIDPDDNRLRENSNHTSNKNKSGLNPISSRHSDTLTDPVDAVSLAFGFLKDETDSIATDNDGNIDSIEARQVHNQAPVYRFRPPQVTGITKKFIPRTNNNNSYYNYHESTNGLFSSNSSSQNRLDDYYSNKSNNNNNNNNQPYLSQQHINNHPYYHHRYYHQQKQQQPQAQLQQQQRYSQYKHIFPNANRARSETHLYNDEQPINYRNSRFEGRLVNGNGVPIPINPIWNGMSPTITGSQPNLLSYDNVTDSKPFYNQSNIPFDGRIPSSSGSHIMYSSYPDNKTGIIPAPTQENRQRVYAEAKNQSNRKQLAQSQYLDTNEFILRASNGQPLRQPSYQERRGTRDYRPHSMNIIGNMVDVYY